MADIVDSLRDHEPGIGGQGCSDCYAGTMDRAADEIERLRAMLGEALAIACGSGADFTWQVNERLTELRAYQQQPNKEG